MYKFMYYSSAAVTAVKNNGMCTGASYAITAT
jgi:hypothetical protein